VSFSTLVLLALGLAMDATAVAAARGALGGVRWRDAVMIVLLFGGAHLAMPALGAVAGTSLGDIIERWDHWVAFVLLVAIGGKMFVQAVRGVPTAPIGLAATAVLAVVTAVDSLAIGVTLPMLNAPVIPAIATIGGVTALASGAGLAVGRWYGSRAGARADAVGGLVLIAMGTKILVSHI
jgi:putative Mn2+ efflux pump MntP